jgi:hypothetical protein
LSNGISLAHYGGQTIDATDNWFGTTTYSTIFNDVQGPVVFVPYCLDAACTNSGGGPTAIENLVVTYTPNANEEIFVQV